MLTIQDIQGARERIAEGVVHTPCPESIPLSELCGCRVWSKLDYLQRTGSFKERGALNALLQLDEAARRRGVVAASAGNHALGLAWHGKRLGIPVTVVMPRFAPLIKASTCEKLGARVIKAGASFAEARKRADQEAEAGGLRYVHGFDDPAIIAGQGTMALEVLEQVPGVEAIVAPVGGGGLIAGVALAVKSLRPEVQIIGVEAERAANFSAARRAGRPVATEPRNTLADGLATGGVGENAFALADPRIDELVQVSEADLAMAVFRLIELEKSVVEGAAAAPLAAFIGGQLTGLSGKRVVLLLCGGNIDLTILDRIIEHGLVRDGRLFRFTAVISDRPGGLAALTRLIADAGASVKQIAHDRAFSGPEVAQVLATCVVETSDRAHIDHLLAALQAAGLEVVASSRQDEPGRVAG
ncbi:MAG: threonine ammonia-lyase [Gammaproteobacteria bacterium]|nr:threonine ammonia-lyase [Gammaproteobacteria bacterium]